MLTKQLAADQITAALEGGSNYWIAKISPRYTSHTHYSEPEQYGSNMVERVVYDEDGPTTYPLNWLRCQEAFRIMQEKYPWHAKNMLDETGDAETGDVFLQCAVLGEIIYG